MTRAAEDLIAPSAVINRVKSSDFAKRTININFPVSATIISHGKKYAVSELIVEKWLPSQHISLSSSMANNSRKVTPAKSKEQSDRVRRR